MTSDEPGPRLKRKVPGVHSKKALERARRAARILLLVRKERHIRRRRERLGLCPPPETSLFGRRVLMVIVSSIIIWTLFQVSQPLWSAQNETMPKIRLNITGR